MWPPEPKVVGSNPALLKNGLSGLQPEGPFFLSAGFDGPERRANSEDERPGMGAEVRGRAFSAEQDAKRKKESRLAHFLL